MRNGGAGLSLSAAFFTRIGVGSVEGQKVLNIGSKPAGIRRPKSANPIDF